MNLALTNPFALQQDYPDVSTHFLRSGHCTCVRFNRKGDYLAAGRTDGTVVIFDMETQGVARKLKGHTRNVQSLSWSKDGRYLLTSSQDWKCIIWDLKDASLFRKVRFEGPVYHAELDPINPCRFAASLFDDQPLLVDVTNPVPVKYNYPSAPKRNLHDADEPINEKQAASDAKSFVTVSVFTLTGEHLLAGTNKGWLNIIDVATRTTLYSTKVCAGVIMFLRLSQSGRDLVVNATDRVVRTYNLPSNLNAPDLNPDTIVLDVEHKFQNIIERLSWNHVCFSATGEYVTATTYNNHDIYIWERDHGSLVKLLEGPKEEMGVVEWHPHRPLVASCGLETGRIHIWDIEPEQRWSALAPDFVEVEENVEYEEAEDEFDIHPQEEIQKRRLDLEDEDVDVLTMLPVQGQVVGDDEGFRMPVELDGGDSDSGEEYVTVKRGEMRRKSPGEGRNYGLDGVVDGDGELPRKKSKTRQR